MDWPLILLLLPFAALGWWLGYVSMNRYRKIKHKLRADKGE